VIDLRIWYVLRRTSRANIHHQVAGGSNRARRWHVLSRHTFRCAESDDRVGGIVAFNCNLATASVGLSAVASTTLCSALSDLRRSHSQKYTEVVQTTMYQQCACLVSWPALDTDGVCTQVRSGRILDTPTQLGRAAVACE